MQRFRPESRLLMTAGHLRPRRAGLNLPAPVLVRNRFRALPSFFLHLPGTPPQQPGRNTLTNTLGQVRHTPATGAATESHPSLAGNPSPQAGLHILLAEDDAMVARSTLIVLRRFGHTVIHAGDGDTAWAILRERLEAFDVLLLDVLMPFMSGPELARHARTAGFTGLIVLMSGRFTELHPNTRAQLGIRTLMTKPFMPSDLERALQSGS